MNLKKTALFAGLCFFRSFTAYSNTALPAPSPGEVVLLRSKETNKTEFSAYTKTEPVKTYGQYQLDRNRKTPRPVHLRSLLKQAQMEFLSYEPERSKKTFRIITGHIHSFDWNKEERQIIFYSLLRLAQMEKDRQKQKLLIQEALAFKMDLSLDMQVFPPPVAKLYLQMKSKTVFVTLDLEKLFPRHEIVLINGKLYSNQEEVSLPYGMYRVTAFSSSHTAYTRVLSLSRFVSKSIVTSPLTGGSCRKPVLTPALNDLQPDYIHILFPNFCVWRPQINQLVNLVNKKEMLPAGIQMPKAEPIQRKKAEEEWLWLGAAVLLIGTVSLFVLKAGDDHKKPEKKNEPQPAIKIGF